MSGSVYIYPWALGTLTVAFLDRFSPKLAQGTKEPLKVKTSSHRGQHRTTSSPIFPDKKPF